MSTFIDPLAVVPLVDDDAADWSKIETAADLAAVIEHYRDANGALLRAAAVELAVTLYGELNVDAMTEIAARIYSKAVALADAAVDAHAAVIERQLFKGAGKLH